MTTLTNNDSNNSGSNNSFNENSSSTLKKRHSKKSTSSSSSSPNSRRLSASPIKMKTQKEEQHEAEMSKLVLWRRPFATLYYFVLELFYMVFVYLGELL